MERPCCLIHFVFIIGGEGRGPDQSPAALSRTTFRWPGHLELAPAICGYIYQCAKASNRGFGQAFEGVEMRQNPVDLSPRNHPARHDLVSYARMFANDFHGSDQDLRTGNGQAATIVGKSASDGYKE